LRASLSRAEKIIPVVMPVRFIKQVSREAPMTLELPQAATHCAPSKASCGTTNSTVEPPDRNICAPEICQQRYTMTNPKWFGRTPKPYSAATFCTREAPLAGAVAGAACAAVIAKHLNLRSVWFGCHHPVSTAVVVGRPSRACHVTVPEIPSSATVLVLYSTNLEGPSSSRGSHHTVQFLFLLHRAVPEFHEAPYLPY